MQIHFPKYKELLGEHAYLPNLERETDFVASWQLTKMRTLVSGLFRHLRCTVSNFFQWIVYFHKNDDHVCELTNVLWHLGQAISF